MICKPCRLGGFHHSECRSRQGIDPMAETPLHARTWCDCQHKPRPVERYETPGMFAPVTLVVDVPALLR